MLTKVTIQRFRGIDEFSAEVKPITALLGPNSSGKTTVLHAVRTACELLRMALDSHSRSRLEEREEATWIALSSELILADHRSISALHDWRALFVNQAVGEGVEAILWLDFEDEDPIQCIEARIRCASNEQLKLSVSVRSTQALERVAGLSKRSKKINELLTEHLKKSVPRAVLVPPFYGTVPDEEYRARVVINRMLGTGDQSHVVRNLVASLDRERFERLNAFLSDTLGARLTYRTSGDRLQTESPLRVLFTDTDGELELSAAGAGLINLIALYAALSRWRQEAQGHPLIFLLDEPEAHLAPRLQAESASRLGRLVTEEFGAQLLMATHSVDILNRISQEGALLLRCDRNASPSVTPLAGDAKLFEDLATWTDLTPYTAINFLASRRIVFCEGKTELTLLPLLGKLLYRNHPSRLDAFDRWSFVELEGTGNAGIAKLLDKLLSSEAVRTADSKAPFQIEVVLDRDYERSPGTERGVADNVTRTVWSRHSIESLFLDPGVLYTWISAFLRQAGPNNDLAEKVDEAVSATDHDTELNDATEQRLVAAAVSAKVHAGEKITAGYGRAVKEAVEHAQKAVREEPAVWQRGKDRAKKILGRVRETLPPADRAHFPTTIERLIEQTELNRIGDPRKAIPAELLTFLERLSG